MLRVSNQIEPAAPTPSSRRPRGGAFSSVWSLAVAAWLVLGGGSAFAVILDWDLLKWPDAQTFLDPISVTKSGSVITTNYATFVVPTLTATYYAVASSPNLTNQYIDAEHTNGSITVTITGDANYFTYITQTLSGKTYIFTNHNTYFTSDMPQSTNTLTGGISPAENSLRLDLNWSTNTQRIQITVTFNNYTNGVTNLNFQIFDVDRNGGGPTENTYVDQITNLYGTYTNSAPFAPEIFANSPSNVVVGSGLTEYLYGTNQAVSTTSNGNVIINFSTNLVDSFSFTYGNDPSAQGNPAQQFISLYDFSITPLTRVPEVHPSVVAAAMCGLMAGWRAVKSRLKRPPV
jgi:hypothetical protein